MINMIADLRDPDDAQGRSYRQTNAEKPHTIPIGTLVQLSNGARAFVVFHTRDCDQTPLYYLALYPDETEQIVYGFKNPDWHGGYAATSLEVISLPSDP